MVADTRDRRQVMIWTQSTAAFFAGLLAIITWTGYDSVAMVYLLTAAGAAAMAFALSYLLLAITGASDTVSTVIRATLRQMITPDHLRGRMTGVNMMFFMGGPQLGELEAGLVAAALGAPFSIISGGIATILLTGWVAWKYPQLWRYTNQKTTEREISSA